MSNIVVEEGRKLKLMQCFDSSNKVPLSSEMQLLLVDYFLIFGQILIGGGGYNKNVLMYIYRKFCLQRGPLFLAQEYGTNFLVWEYAY